MDGHVIQFLPKPMEASMACDLIATYNAQVR
jgi:hypothetical protein